MRKRSLPQRHGARRERLGGKRSEIERPEAERIVANPKDNLRSEISNLKEKSD
jgi:hypothetical protein